MLKRDRAAAAAEDGQDDVDRDDRRHRRLDAVLAAEVEDRLVGEAAQEADAVGELLADAGGRPQVQVRERSADRLFGAIRVLIGKIR